MRDVSASARRWAFDSSPAAPSSSPPGWLSALLNAVYARSESSLRAAPPRPANTSGAATTRRAADADAPAARGSWSAATRTWRTVVREVEEESSMGAESSVIVWAGPECACCFSSAERRAWLPNPDAGVATALGPQHGPAAFLR